jgi:23S rRNA pseudouridine2605 synthase
MATGTIIYKCSCGKYHPWSFDGDCRDDANRYSSPEEYADENDLDPDDIEVRAIDADEGDDETDDEDEDEDDDEDNEDEEDGDEADEEEDDNEASDEAAEEE